MAPVKEDDENEKDENGDDEDKEEPVMELLGKVKQMDETLDGALLDLLKENIKSFKNGAKVGSTTPTLRVSKKRYIVVGLGNGKDWTGAGFSIGKTIADKVNNEAKVENAHVLLPASFLSNATLARDMATAFYSELHVDNRYRTGAKIKKPAKDLQTVSFFAEGEGQPAMDALNIGKQLAAGVVLTKDVVNAPHNVLNSESLAETAKRIAKESNGVIQCEILGKKECEERGMGAYLGVARGSETDPQFIHLTYKPKGDIKSKVAIVGKGLLFDTGGYNIKTQMMEYMKFDCGGAAAVLGAARAIGMLKPPGVEAHIIVAACENMISHKSYVPSDILTASNGKTIEVMNTDAEGRLTLADALVYSDKELGCEKIIELSTLTGACMIALGKDICGLWTDDDDLANELLDISRVTGDKSWRMPLAKEYNEQLESKFADMKNVGTKYGGSITAALFLQNFVSKKKPFAHLDIAGPVWSDKTGASGFGAKLVVEWVTRQGQKEEQK
jgi:leucyl aminopeptidase